MVALAHALDGELHRLTEGHTLTWVPEHPSFNMIGKKQLPDGTNLIGFHW